MASCFGCRRAARQRYTAVPYDAMPAVEDSRPRATPPPPTRPGFPNYDELKCKYSGLTDISTLEKLFRIKHIKFLSSHHLNAVDVHLEEKVSLNNLVPRGFLPPRKWQKDPRTISEDDQAEYDEDEPLSTEMLSNGGSVPGHEAFYNRMNELFYSNDEGYRFIAQLPPLPGQRPVKIVNFRRYWVLQQQMGSYWDTSLDNVEYSDSDMATANAANAAEDRASHRSKRTKTAYGYVLPSSPPKSLQDHSNTKIAEKELGDSLSAESGVVSVNNGSLSHGEHTSLAQLISRRAAAMSKEADDQSAKTYTGRRHSNGANMPGALREDLIRQFVEPIVWTFGCKWERTTTQPHVYINHTKLDVDHIARIYRSPQDRLRSRANILEGPLLLIQCSRENSFDDYNGNLAQLFRELGAMMSVAQERAREGKVERLPGAGAWWAERARWGGGSGEAIGKPLAEDNVLEELTISDGDGQLDAQRLKDRKEQERMKARNQHSLIRGYEKPSSLWEKRIDYKRIGKPACEDRDTIYMISCINHHVAIIRLSVHSQYLDYLASTNIITSTGGKFPKWTALPMERSRWFDLLDPRDRVLAMRAVWGIMAYLMRGAEMEEKLRERERRGESEDVMSE